MADPTYVIPGAAIHSFCMFAPFAASGTHKQTLRRKRSNTPLRLRCSFIFFFFPSRLSRLLLPSVHGHSIFAERALRFLSPVPRIRVPVFPDGGGAFPDAFSFQRRR